MLKNILFLSLFVYLEHFQKSCSRPVKVREAADLLGFGFVFAPAFAKRLRRGKQSQAAAVPQCGILRSSLANPQNLSLPNGYNFSSNASFIIGGTLPHRAASHYGV
jgi:hypothetical protein